MKISIVLLILVLTSSIQAQTLEWVKSIEGTQHNRGKAIAVDASGNVYTTGEFLDTTDFDPNAGVTNLPSMGYTDIFIQKLDPSGNLVWAKSIGEFNNDGGTSIALDGSGNVYTTGHFSSGTVDFDPNAGVYNLTSVSFSPDIFIQKLDPSGNLIWAKSMGGTQGDYGEAITIDGLGNVYTTGTFTGTVDFDPDSSVYNLTSIGVSNIFIQKLDSVGNFIWAKRVGATTGYRQVRSIKIDGFGNVYTLGYFSGTMNFDPNAGVFNLNAAGTGASAFMQKLDSDGNLVWAKSIGGTSSIHPSSMALDASNNIYTTGIFNGTVDFDPNWAISNLTSKNNNSDIFVQKMDASGNFIWAKSMGGFGNDGGSSIALDDSSNVYSIGTFSSVADLDPGVDTFDLTAIGGRDVYVLKLNSNGDFIWAINMQTLPSLSLLHSGQSITVDNLNNIYATGNFIGTIDFDPGPDTTYISSLGETIDIFIQKLNGATNLKLEVLQQPQINLYPNPSSGLVTIDFGDLRGVSVKVFSLNGQLVHYKQNIYTSTYQFELDESAGVYFVEIMAQKKKRFYKLIKR